MLEVSRDLDLLQKPLGAEHSREFGTQHFDGDVAVVFDVVGQIHGRHATGAEFFLDEVAVGEGGGEAVNEIWHCV